MSRTARPEGSPEGELGGVRSTPRPDLEAAIDRALDHPFDDIEVAGLGPRTRGKVRDIYDIDTQLVLVTTDRLSAFDVVLGTVPYKGQVLNQLSAHWFATTRHIVPNHLVEVPDPNVTVARTCRPLPVEVIVRGFITGVTDTALWTRYTTGERVIYGVELPEGLRKNDRLPAAIITPTTKAEAGGHDERLTSDEVVSTGRVEAGVWARVCEAALALFAHGQVVAERAGLVLVDTKYEFGLDPQDEVVLIDEVHTPDSSRYWLADTWAERVAAGHEPDSYDKELIRLEYKAAGYSGHGDPPPLSADLARRAARRYIDVYERLTGTAFEPGAYPAAPRVAAAVEPWAGSAHRLDEI